MKKRGFSLPPQMLILLIMVLIAGILIFIFAVRAPRALCNGEVQTCRTSLLVVGRAEQFSFSLTENCPASELDPFKRESPEEVNGVAALELEKCAFKFGGGRINYDDAKIMNLISRGWENQKICFKCAVLDFSQYRKKEDYKEANNQNQGFKDYIRENNIHCSTPKTTFSEYFRKIRVDENRKYMEVFGHVGDLDPEKNYIIYGAMYKASKFGPIEQTVGGRTIYPLVVQIVPEDSPEVKSCDIMLG